MVTEKGLHESPTSEPDRFPIITINIFLSFDFEYPISSLNSVQTYSLRKEYLSAAENAQKTGNNEAGQACTLLAEVMGIHFRPTDRASPWGPMMQMDNRRTLIPSDLKGAQTDELFALLQHIKNPILRSRVSDVVWTNDKRKHQAGSLAVEAYCDCIQGLLNGSLVSEIDKDSKATLEALHFLQRALNIAYTISKKSNLPDRVRAITQQLYKTAYDDQAYYICKEVAELGCYHGILDFGQTAKELETLASSSDDSAYLMVIKGCYDVAAYFYSKVSDEDGQHRCELLAVEQMLAMQAQVSSAGAKAHWVMDALQALRHIPNTGDKRAGLEKELRRLQEASTQEMGSVSVPLDLSDERSGTLDAFSECDLPTALLQFALLDYPKSPEKLTQEALGTVQTSPLMAAMPMAYIDHSGKTVAKISGATPGKKPDPKWLDMTINRNESLGRHCTVVAGIDPAIEGMTQRFTIVEEHILPIINYCPFVPIPQKQIMALGFTKLLQRDFVSAAYLLIPQLEPCLRHVLRSNGADPTKRRHDSTEEDRSLGSLFDNHRAELERILTPAVSYQIELIFEKEVGPSLRHSLAHGKISAGGCYHPDVVYGCWLLFHVCCRFVMPNWDRLIVPAIPE